MFLERAIQKLGLLNKKICLYGPDGEINTFILDQTSGNINISQIMEDGQKAHWQPHNRDGEILTIKTQQQALNFLEDQMYTTTIKQKGGNDK